MDVTIIYTTLSLESDAQALIQELLKRRAVACGVALPAQSAYWWQGAIASEQEVAVLFKTTPERAFRAKELVAQLHPYDTPAVLLWSVSANDDYVEWVQSQTTQE